MSAGLVFAVIDVQGKTRPTIDFTAYSWCEKTDLSDYRLPTGRRLFVSLMGPNGTSVSLRQPPDDSQSKSYISLLVSAKPQWKSVKPFPPRAALLFTMSKIKGAAAAENRK